MMSAQPDCPLFPVRFLLQRRCAGWPPALAMLVLGAGLVFSGGAQGVDISVNAGSDQRVTTGTMVMLSGTATEGVGTKSWAWTQTGGSPMVTIGNADQANASFTAPPVTAATVLEFTLTATDESGTATDTIDVTVGPALSAEAGSDQVVVRGASVTLSGTAAGGHGAKSRTWTQTGGSPTVTIDDADQANASFMAPPVTAATELEFTLTVADESGSATDVVHVTVIESTLGAEAKSNQTVTSGMSVTLSGSTTGGHGTKSWAWMQAGGSPMVVIDDADQATASFTAPPVTAATELKFTLTATDESGTATDTVRVAVGPALSVEARPDRVVVQRVPVTLSGMATDGLGRKSYAWAQTGGSPKVTIDDAGQATAGFMAPPVTMTTELEFTLTVTDKSGTATDTVRVTVIESALGAEAGSDRVVVQGVPVTLLGTATDGLGMKSYAWAQTGGTPTVTIDHADQATASFTAPPVTAATELEFMLTVTDESGTATDMVRVTVGPALSAEAGPDQVVVQGVPVTLSGTAADGLGTKSYAWVQTKDSPMVTIDHADQATASFTAPPVAVTIELEFTLTVTDESGSAMDTVRTTVIESALGAEAGANQVVVQGTPVTLSGMATGGHGTRSWAWTQTGGSPAVTIDDADQATASFTAPPVTATEELEFTLTVTDESGTATDTVGVRVTESPLNAEAGSDRVVASAILSDRATGRRVTSERRSGAHWQ